jgi:integrase
MKISYLKKRKVWQVDYNTKKPNVKDPDGNGKKVGRRTTKGKTRFNTKAEAEDWAARVQLALNNIDLDLNATERIEYRSAKDKLGEKGYEGTSLLDVVNDWLKYRNRIISDKSVLQSYDLWIESYKSKVINSTRSESTGDDVERIRPALEPFFDLNIGELEQPQVAEALAKHIRIKWEGKKPRTLRNTFTKTNQFINWCKRKDVKLLPSNTPNPLDDLSEVEVPLGSAPYVLTIIEAREILHTAHLTDSKLHLLPFMILHCLCGLRPSEVYGMTWDNIHLNDLNEPFIHVPERTTGKNKRPRHIQLKEFPSIVEWFKACDWSKPLYPYKKKDRNYHVQRRNLLAEAVILPVDAPEEDSSKYQDFGRHSCATYLYALGSDQRTITERIGNSSRVLMNHYINNKVTKSQAQEYFNIMPVKSKDKLVKFSG